MLPKSRTASANGLTSLPSSSIGAMPMERATAPGPDIPGNFGKIVPMYPLKPRVRNPAISTTRNTMIASVAVTARLPVGEAPNGTRPSRLP